MSQKVRIDGVRHAGASVFLGVDHCGNPRWTRNSERVMEWLCDGWRTRFNQRREQRPRNIPVKDDATGEVVDWVKEPLGGPDVADCSRTRRLVFSARGWRRCPRPYWRPPTRSKAPNGSPDSRGRRPSEAASPASSRAIAAWASSAGATPPDRATQSSIRPAGNPVWSLLPA